MKEIKICAPSQYPLSAPATTAECTSESEMNDEDWRLNDFFKE